MNKKVLFGVAAFAIAAVSVFNVNFNSRSNNLSDVSLANVEALAQELPPPSYDHSCYYILQSGMDVFVYDCNTCYLTSAYAYVGSSHCSGNY